ncbi:DUF5930 domain-containing protein [Pontivivens ytuae]|uniref:Peptidoglycan DD-metalloendopeptidase family protein n=1 Tax=Pontivivens ytuae TaxID=2789856 RepID=A0A7S9LS65_9RHOB|nr:DUF5930 domain-containing protein [Pontivivens ytuae]QPH54252.1 peptidoglycan DD-metalloendopeptidase family protein [Pontivivens ytuae]
MDRLLPEKRVYLKSGDDVAHVRLTPLTQAAACAGGVLLAGWTLTATALSVAALSGPEGGTSTTVVRGMHESRIAELTEQRAAYAAAAEEARVRAEQATALLAAQQADLIALTETATEAQTAGEDMHAKLDARARELAEREADLAASVERLAAVERSAVAREMEAEDLVRTVSLLLDNLDRTAADRDMMAAEVAAFDEVKTALETRAILAEQQQERVFTRLEQAVEGGIAELDGVFQRAGTDVDALMDQLQGSYVGQGGPEVMSEDEEAHLIMQNPQAARLMLLLGQIDQLNMRRIAMERMPFDHPVAGPHRTSSRFGNRRDPINGRIRRHEGLDFAGPVGTAITAAAEGTVTYANRQGAYGNVVKIRHAFGFETVYAHLHRIHVAVGDEVTRGDRIGDMGSTGRSTGSHLHYEIRLGGEPVDPMTYLKAAEDVL